MGDLTRNLSRHEFACECGCGFDTVDFQLVDWIQSCADSLVGTSGRDVWVQITGGNRCAEHNASIGGAENSQHIYGRAADHKFFYKVSGEQIDPEFVAKYYEGDHPECGLGRYSNRTHLDSRGSKARWEV